MLQDHDTDLLDPKFFFLGVCQVCDQCGQEIKALYRGNEPARADYSIRFEFHDRKENIYLV